MVDKQLDKQHRCTNYTKLACFFQKKNQNALFHYCNLVYLYQINVYFYF